MAILTVDQMHTAQLQEYRSQIDAELKKRAVSSVAVHPGEILNHEFMLPTAVESLASRTGLERSAIEDILGGQTPISDQIAQSLSQALGTTPDFWINLQVNYDAAKA